VAPSCHSARTRCGDTSRRRAASAVPITSSIPTHHCGKGFPRNTLLATSHQATVTTGRACRETPHQTEHVLRTASGLGPTVCNVAGGAEVHGATVELATDIAGARSKRAGGRCRRLQAVVAPSCCNAGCSLGHQPDQSRHGRLHDTCIADLPGRPCRAEPMPQRVSAQRAERRALGQVSAEAVTRAGPLRRLRVEKDIQQLGAAVARLIEHGRRGSMIPRAWPRSQRPCPLTRL
jgi:hypothetical protein